MYMYNDEAIFAYFSYTDFRGDLELVTGWDSFLFEGLISTSRFLMEIEYGLLDIYQDSR